MSRMSAEELREHKARIDAMPLQEKLLAIADAVQLGMDCKVRVWQDPDGGKLFVQIQCWRRDVITGEMGWGYGGKYYPSEHASSSEIVQAIFGLYKGYWEHEARENFTLFGLRPFGPHMDTWAVLEVAHRVDVRSQRHTDDQPSSRERAAAGVRQVKAHDF